jgi:antitoxin HicB
MTRIEQPVDLRHSSRLDAMEAAFNKLGKRLEVSIV